MECPKWQLENPQNVKFCVHCGNKSETLCQKCGSSNSLAFNFCGECGYDLRESKVAPTIDYSEPQSYTPKFLADKILTTSRQRLWHIGRDFAFRILQTITGMREELKYYLFNLQGLEFIYEKGLSHFQSLIGQYFGFKGRNLHLGIKYSENSFKKAEKIDDIDLMVPF